MIRWNESSTNIGQDLAELCQACGLCCDGSLFGRVTLDAREVVPARKRRLRVMENGAAFEQPCSALAPRAERRVCSIYGERPGACRAFACRLHDRHRREGGALEPRMAAVRRVRLLVAYLESTGLTAADLGDDAPDLRPDHALAKEAFAELTRRLEDDFARA